MGGPVDEIRFLVASENRVRVLEYLYETPADREELADELAVSRPTLSRVLTGLEERRWISQHGSDCAITSSGAFLVESFRSLRAAIETMQRLEAVIDSLPIEEFDFELGRLHDATVTTPTQTDPGAPLRRARQLILEADEFHFLTNTVVSSLAEVLRERTVRGELTVVGVVTEELLDTVSDSPAFGDPTREMIASGGAEFYRYDGTVSLTLGVADGTTASITQVDQDGSQRAQIETDDEHVCSWVGSTIETYRRESERIDAGTFSQ